MDIISCQMENLGSGLLCLDAPHFFWLFTSYKRYPPNNYTKLCSFLNIDTFFFFFSLMLSLEGGVMCLNLSARPLIGLVSSFHDFHIWNTIFLHTVYGLLKVYLPILRMSVFASFKKCMYIFYIFYMIDIRWEWSICSLNHLSWCQKS